MQQGKPDTGDILIVSHGLDQIYERGFCNGISDIGVNHTLVSSDLTYYDALRPGVRTLNLRGSQDNRRSRWQKAWNMVRYHASLMWLVARTRPRVVHVIGHLWPIFLCGVVEGLWFRIFAGRYVLTVHNLEPHDGASQREKRFIDWSFRLAQTLVVHTAKIGRELTARHGIPASRIVEMGHGIEPRQSPPEAGAAHDNAAPWNILFFGKVMRYKGIDILLQALDTMPFEFRLVIAGVGTDATLTAEINAAIAAHPKFTHIVWHNRFILEDELRTLFSAADVTVLPYRHIDQSGVLFQSLYYGVPLVATQVGSFADFVTPDTGELAERVDAQAFRDALVRCHARRAELTRSQVAAAGKRHEWQHTAKALLPLYLGNRSDPDGRPIVRSGAAT